MRSQSTHPLGDIAGTVVLVISVEEQVGAFAQTVEDSLKAGQACAETVVDTLPLNVF